MRILPILAGLLFAGAAYAQPTPPPPDMLPPYPGQGAPTPSQIPPNQMPPGQMQAPPPGEMAPQQPPMQQGAPPQGRQHISGRDRFAMANTTHDGRLTMDQAQAAGWRPVARHFAEIDRDRKGYVTMQDIKQWHAEKKASKQQMAPPPAQ